MVNFRVSLAVIDFRLLFILLYLYDFIESELRQRGVSRQQRPLPLQLRQQPRLARLLVPLGVRADSQVPGDGVHGLRVPGRFLRCTNDKFPTRAQLNLLLLLLRLLGVGEMHGIDLRSTVRYCTCEVGREEGTMRKLSATLSGNRCRKTAASDMNRLQYANKHAQTEHCQNHNDQNDGQKRTHGIFLFSTNLERQDDDGLHTSTCAMKYFMTHNTRINRHHRQRLVPPKRPAYR